MSYPDVSEQGLGALARAPEGRPDATEFVHNWTCVRCGDVVHHGRPADGICSSCRVQSFRKDPEHA